MNTLNKANQAEGQKNNQMKIDFLYLDLSVCDRCQGSDLNLEKAVEILSAKFPNKNFELNKIHINSVDLAYKEKFVSSPTIRINGSDLPVELRENTCDACGDFCGDSIDCRIWVHNDVEFDSAPTEMIVDLVSNYAEGKLQLEAQTVEYTIPENIIHFFSARLKKETEKVEVEAESCGCNANSSSCCG